MYFIGFADIFDCSCLITFDPYPPNFILGKIHFAFVNSQFLIFQIWGIAFCYLGDKILPQNLLDYNIIFNSRIHLHLSYKFFLPLLQLIVAAPSCYFALLYHNSIHSISFYLGYITVLIENTANQHLT